MANSNVVIRDSNGTTTFGRILLTEVNFLEIQEYLKFIFIDINNILNMSAKYLSMKKEKFHWKLNRKYSYEYYSNVLSKSRLDHLIG